MTRPLRIEYAEAHYHVTTRGNERKAIFRDDTAMKSLRTSMRQARQGKWQKYEQVFGR
jgi:REP element-mobilizing transposase RayT